MSDGGAQRLILRGGGAAAAGFLIRFGARLLFVLVAGRLYGASLFGAFAIAVAVVELGVTIGGVGMKRLLFQLLDERRAGRPAPHVVIDAALLVAAASALPAAAIMAAIAMLPASQIAGNSAAALFLLAPMIVGQSLIDLLLAATRWTHRIGWDVWARSVVEPYVGVAAAAWAWWAGYEATGLVISYWAGTLAALVYAGVGARRCLGPAGLAAWHFGPARLAAIMRSAALPTLSDFASGLYARLDLYLVGLILGEVPSGIYAMARQLRIPIRQVRQALDGLLAPIVSRTLTHAGPTQTAQALASATRLILAIQLAMLVALVAIGEPLLAWIGPEFAAGYLPMLLIAAAETVQSAFGVSELILLYRRPSALLWITAAGVAASLLAGWLLIPAYGIAGAGLAALIAAAATAGLRRLFLRAAFGAAVPLGRIAPPIVSALAGIAAIFGATGLLVGAGEGLRFALACGAGLLVYWFALALALHLAGERLALTHFVVEESAGS